MRRSILYLSGYTHQFDQSQVERGLRQLVNKAHSAGLALALGTCFVEPDDRRCYTAAGLKCPVGKAVAR